MLAAIGVWEARIGSPRFEKCRSAAYDELSFIPNNQETMTYFRHPTLADGPQVFSLIASCPPLDQNSRYCNLLQTSHFSNTCAGAWNDDVLLGFVSGYLLPTAPNVYFLWQIAVSPQARGQNMAQRLIDFILQADATQQVTHLQTTITDDNGASQAVFNKMAQRYQADIERTLWLEQDQHFAGHHASEWLYTIGPLPLQHLRPNQEES